MEKMNLNNYEAYFLDYIEGNLSPQEVQDLMNFTKEHPQLKEELQELELLHIEEDKKTVLSSSLKSSLQREESTALSKDDYLFIAATENELSAKDKLALDLLLQEEDKVDKLALYAKSILPKEEVVFEKKHNLYQKEATIIWLRYVSSAVAAAAVFFFFYLNTSEQFYYPNPHKTNKLLTEQKSELNEKLLEYIPLKASKTNPNELLKTPILTKSPVRVMNSQEPTLAENNNLETPQSESLDPIKEDPIASLPVNEVENSMPKEDPPIKKTQPVTKEPKVKKTNDYLTLQEFVKREVDEEILKNKTLIEFVGDEVAELTNDQVKYKQEKDKDGKVKRFALNIGSLGISKF